MQPAITEFIRRSQQKESGGAIQGGPGCAGGSRRGSRQVQSFGGTGAKKWPKTRKNQNNAPELRNYIQDFVQEVLVGQMAQGLPFRRPAAHPLLERGRLNLATIFNTLPEGRRTYFILI